MPHQSDLRVAWVHAGGTCGVLAIAAYLAAAFAPLPAVPSYAAAFAFGPLLAVGCVGLYHAIALERPGPLAQIAAASAVAGGVTVLAMLATQQAIVATLRRTAGAPGAPSADALRAAREAVHAVHLGLDVAWDVLIATAVVLFGVAMIWHPRFGRAMGGLGIGLGTLLLGFNLWFFPVPPASAQSVDWGPFVALWLLAAFVLLIRARPWARARAASSARPA